MPSYVTAGLSGQWLKLHCLLIINIHFSRRCPGRFQIAAADLNTQDQQRNNDNVKESEREEGIDDDTGSRIDRYSGKFDEARSKPNNLEEINSHLSYVIILSA
jgi:hypothetical protein